MYGEEFQEGKRITLYTRVGLVRVPYLAGMIMGNTFHLNTESVGIRVDDKFKDFYGLESNEIEMTLSELYDTDARVDE